MLIPSSRGVEGVLEFFRTGGQADSDQRAMANLRISTLPFWIAEVLSMDCPCYAIISGA